MKIVFDESGNTGCVLRRKKTLNFSTQPNFTLCGVILASNDDEEALKKRYCEFQKRHGIVSEIKGSDLMKRESNALLADFIENILDGVHFSFNIYNKKFYLSSLLCVSILGLEFQFQFGVEFYAEVSAIALEPDDFFVRYCEFIEDVNVQSLREYLQYLNSYKFTFLSSTEQVLTMFIHQILYEGTEESFLSDFMTYGWYEDDNKTNVINLTALGEFIDVIKKENPNVKNSEIAIIHDKNQEFEDMLKRELSQLGLSISFEDSKNNTLIQIADNAVSIVNKVYGDMRNAFHSKSEWLESNSWTMELASMLFSKITMANIKFTVPIPDWTVAFCVKEMFSPNYPKNQRKNIFFNQLYVQYQQRIYLEIKRRTLYVSSTGDVLYDLGR